MNKLQDINKIADAVEYGEIKFVYAPGEKNRILRIQPHKTHVDLINSDEPEKFTLHGSIYAKDRAYSIWQIDTERSFQQDPPEPDICGFYHLNKALLTNFDWMRRLTLTYNPLLTKIKEIGCVLFYEHEGNCLEDIVLTLDVLCNGMLKNNERKKDKSESSQQEQEQDLDGYILSIFEGKEI